MEIQKERPAYVTFVKRAVEDRDATIASGMYTPKDVDFVIITPPGSKDRIERNAEEWFVQMREQVAQQRLPREFLSLYKEAYEEWKATGEVPVNGTYIKNVALFSPAQIEMLLQANLKTVEDLAVATEEAIARLGMGGRAMKKQAESYLASAKNGAPAAQLTALQLENEELRKSNEALAKQVEQLAMQMKQFAANANVKPL